MKPITLTITLVALFISIVLIDSCTQSSNGNDETIKNKNTLHVHKNSKTNEKTLSKVLKNKTNESKDTLLINTRSAVSVWLDSTELNNRRKKYGDDFQTGADDYVYYSNLVDSILKKQKLPRVNADGYRFIKFVKNNGSSTIIRTDTLPAIFTLYFFDPSKAPYNTDITVIEDEYKKFYH